MGLLSTKYKINVFVRGELQGYGVDVLKRPKAAFFYV